MVRHLRSTVLMYGNTNGSVTLPSWFPCGILCINSYSSFTSTKSSQVCELFDLPQGSFQTASGGSIRKNDNQITENCMKSEIKTKLTRYSCACCLNCFDAEESDVIKPDCPYCRTNRTVAPALSGRTLLLLVVALFVFVIAFGIWRSLSIPMSYPKPPSSAHMQIKTSHLTN